MSRKLLNSFLEDIISARLFSTNYTVIDEYKKLNDRCEDIIAKIKARKQEKERGDNG